MVDLSMITGTLSSLKVVADLAKGFSDLRDQAVNQAAVIELQSKISDAISNAALAQSEQLAMIDEIRELKRVLAEHENWERQAARYALRDFGGSTYAYELKAEAANGEPNHRLCPTCFEKRQRSILQFNFTDTSNRDHFKCLPCKADLEFGQAISSSQLCQSSYVSF